MSVKLSGFALAFPTRNFGFCAALCQKVPSLYIRRILGYYLEVLLLLGLFPSTGTHIVLSYDQVIIASPTFRGGYIFQPCDVAALRLVCEPDFGMWWSGVPRSSRASSNITTSNVGSMAQSLPLGIVNAFYFSIYLAVS